MFLHLMFSLQKVLKRHLVECCRNFSIFSRFTIFVFQFTIFVFKFKNTKSFQNIKVNSLSSDELKIC